MIQLPPAVAALGWTLVHFFWQGALVAGVFVLARLASRRSAPESRYALACSALLVMASLPLCTFAVVWTTLSFPTNAGIEVLLSTGSGGPQIDHGWRSIVPRTMPWLLTLWGLGVGILATRSSVGWTRLRRLVRYEARPPESAWQRRIELLSDRIDLRGKIRVLSTVEVSSPIVTGCWRPTILLPLSVFTGLPVAQLESLILHELLHIKRRDLWVHRLQLVLETLFFYQPAIWWISRVVHAEREFCCDAAVVSLTGDRLGYARALTDVESLRSQWPRQALASTGGSLMSRIRSIVNPTAASPSTPLSTAVWSVAAIGLVVALIAATTAIGDSTHGQTPVWMPESVGRWSPLFEQASERHGVDPALLSIVTLVESLGDPESVSSWGAIGLMQIMPATAEKIAAERGIDNFDVETLRDPVTNVDFGAWYLARQIADFGDGSLSAETVTRAAAAYNGGPKRLRRHLDRGQPLSEEAERYSRLVGELWHEREQDDSATFERFIGKKL